MRKLGVWSSKGGVGKTRIATTLARLLSRRLPVGLADMDVLNPNVGDVLGIGEVPFHFTDSKILPITHDGFKVMTTEAIPESDKATLFDGEKTASLALQILDAVDWSGVELLILDMAPGTSDLAIALLKALQKEDGVLLVTGPREEELRDAERTLDALKFYNARLIGAVVNYAYITLPDGKTRVQIGYATSEVSKRLGVKVLSEVPFCIGNQRVEDHLDAEAVLEAMKRRFTLW